jgi:hypothetical protein
MKRLAMSCEGLCSLSPNKAWNSSKGVNVDLEKATVCGWNEVLYSEAWAEDPTWLGIARAIPQPGIKLGLEAL